MGTQAPEQSEADAPALPGLRSADGRAHREQRPRLGLQPASRMPRPPLRPQGPQTQASYSISRVRERETTDHCGWRGMGRTRGSGRPRADNLPFDVLRASGLREIFPSLLVTPWCRHLELAPLASDTLVVKAMKWML